MSFAPVTTDICHALQQGKLCCVTRAPQSKHHQSLCNQTRTEMIARGYRSVTIQLSALNDLFNSPLNNQQKTQQQYLIEWDKYLIKVLWDSFYPTNHVRLSNWLKTTEALAPRERLIQFSHDLLLSELCEAPITILIDSIDVLANVPAAISDMFAWIDYCYELRDTYLSYHHLSFAVFGQANLSKSNLSKSKIASEITAEIAADRSKAFFNELYSQHPSSQHPSSQHLTRPKALSQSPFKLSVQMCSQQRRCVAV